MRDYRKILRIVLLVVIAAVAGYVAQLLRLPGAWLIGPMLVGMGAAMSGLMRLRFPTWVMFGLQGVIGTLVAGAFDPAAFPKIAANWVAVLISVSGTLAASVLVGLLLARFSSLHRATATLGTLPGGASAMVTMSLALGADTPSVAVMQYIRVVLAVLSASLVGRAAIALNGSVAPTGLSTLVAPEMSGNLLSTYALTAVIATVGVLLGSRMRIPAGYMILPLVLGVAASEFGIVRPAWPPGIPEIAYVFMGLSVGLLFDRMALRVIGPQLPAMLVSIVGLIALCGALGVILANLAGTDYLTGFLATTPGGLDSLPAIALTSGADVSLVVAIQMARLFGVVLIGPPLARWLLSRGTPPLVPND